MNDLKLQEKIFTLVYTQGEDGSGPISGKESFFDARYKKKISSKGQKYFQKKQQDEENYHNEVYDYNEIPAFVEEEQDLSDEEIEKLLQEEYIQSEEEFKRDYIDYDKFENQEDNNTSKEILDDIRNFMKDAKTEQNQQSTKGNERDLLQEKEEEENEESKAREDYYESAFKQFDQDFDDENQDEFDKDDAVENQVDGQNPIQKRIDKLKKEAYLDDEILAQVDKQQAYYENLVKSMNMTPEEKAEYEIFQKEALKFKTPEDYENNVVTEDELKEFDEMKIIVNIIESQKQLHQYMQQPVVWTAVQPYFDEKCISKSIQEAEPLGSYILFKATVKGQEWKLAPVSPYLILFIDNQEALYYNYYDFATKNMNPYGSYWPFFWQERVDGEPEEYKKFQGSVFLHILNDQWTTLKNANNKGILKFQSEFNNQLWEVYPKQNDQDLKYNLFIDGLKVYSFQEWPKSWTKKTKKSINSVDNKKATLGDKFPLNEMKIYEEYLEEERKVAREHEQMIFQEQIKTPENYDYIKDEEDRLNTYNPDPEMEEWLKENKPEVYNQKYKDVLKNESNKDEKDNNN